MTRQTVVRDRWMHHVVILAPDVPSLHTRSSIKHPEAITLTQFFEKKTTLMYSAWCKNFKFGREVGGALKVGIARRTVS
jgi:hypothetical protein